MLQPMQQASQEQPSLTSSHFAGLLAALTSPPNRTADGVASADDAGLWNDADLGEDVATLSYERALRAHARYRPADRGDSAAMHAAGLRMDDWLGTSGGVTKGGEGTSAEAGATARIACDGDLRKASVTIRLSKAECEQLRKRAGEAGLTISAYLRSCTFEAEALRAQVKEALEELRKAGSEGTREAGIKGWSHVSGRAAGDHDREQRNKKSHRRNLFRWIIRVLTRRH
ncbi:MAG: hypothetical protein WBC92_11680 [Terracidiphilus sp.]